MNDTLFRWIGAGILSLVLMFILGFSRLSCYSNGGDVGEIRVYKFDGGSETEMTVTKIRTPNIRIRQTDEFVIDVREDDVSFIIYYNQDRPGGWLDHVPAKQDRPPGWVGNSFPGRLRCFSVALDPQGEANTGTIHYTLSRKQ